jgi:hypothetical protein
MMSAPFAVDGVAAAPATEGDERMEWGRQRDPEDRFSPLPRSDMVANTLPCDDRSEILINQDAPITVMQVESLWAAKGRQPKPFACQGNFR